MVGTASDTLAMSVERVGRSDPSSSASNLRPRRSALARKDGEQIGVADHVGVVGSQGIEADLGPGRLRPGLEAGPDPRLECGGAPRVSGSGP